MVHVILLRSAAYGCDVDKKRTDNILSLNSVFVSNADRLDFATNYCRRNF